MKVKKVSNLVAEIDGTEVTLIPVASKTINVPNPSTGSTSVPSGSTSHQVFAPAVSTDKIVGYLIVAPEEVGV